MTTAGAASAATTAHHEAVASTAQAHPSVARLLSAGRSATAKKTVSLPAKYTVKSGDSLSKIAGDVYHDSAAWPVLYWANKGEIRWANEIQTGQVLNVPVKPGHIPAAPGQLDPTPAPAPAETQAAPAAAEPAPASTVEAAPAQPAPAQPAPAHAAPAQAASTYSGSGSFQHCVITRESGGNSQVMNSSGHYGLYQFSASTWAAYGGNPASFGNASVAEQNRVFNNAIAAGGQSNWSAYDGC